MDSFELSLSISFGKYMKDIDYNKHYWNVDMEKGGGPREQE
jgi:hypothetical protein